MATISAIFHSVLTVASRCNLSRPRHFAALLGLCAVALIVVVATETRTTSAQPPAAIEETELIRLREVNSWTPFHWGGGTVRQMLDRLIQRECAVDAAGGSLWERLDGGWRRYALLNDRATARGVSAREAGVPPRTIIVGMLDEVPRSTYYVRCVARCGILSVNANHASSLADCPSQFDRADQTQAWQVRRSWGEVVDGQLVERKFIAPPPRQDEQSANGLCWPLEHERLAAWRLHLVLPYFAVHPGTCLLRESDTAGESGTAGGGARAGYLAPPVLALYEWHPLPTSSELNDVPLDVTVHEYCHANQYWHMQRSSRYASWNDVESRFPQINISGVRTNAEWWAYATPAGRAFIDAVGMRWGDSGGWAVRSWPFNVMYRQNPLELAADVCVEYFGKILEIDSSYTWVTWAPVAGKPGGTWKDRAARVDWDPGAVLTEPVVKWLEDYVLLPQVHPGSGTRPTDLGRCEEDMRVGLGQSCSVPAALHPFVVPSREGGSAWSPCDQRIQSDLNDARIKVDVEKAGTCGNLPAGWTFQAERVGDAWFVRVVGQWVDRGNCRRGQVISPGQYCTVSGWQTSETDQSPLQFRVYAVDELVPSDTRSLYSKGGYAVLYYWPGGERPDPDNGRLHHGRVRHPVTGDALFEAAKLRFRGEWRVITTPRR